MRYVRERAIVDSKPKHTVLETIAIVAFLVALCYAVYHVLKYACKAVVVILAVLVDILIPTVFLSASLVVLLIMVLIFLATTVPLNLWILVSNKWRGDQQLVAPVSFREALDLDSMGNTFKLILGGFKTFRCTRWVVARL